MKKQFIYLALGSLAIACSLTLLPKEVHAHQGTRYDPCICYTYFSNGHIEVGQSCDHPNQNGACPNLVVCLPQNKEDR